MRGALLVLLVGACNREAPAPAKPRECERVPFADSSPVPEASGAAWMTIGGKLSLVVISDSGNDGAYAIVDPESGATTEQGKLPLAGKDDDLEGVAIHAGKLAALTSPGWVREWQRAGTGFELVAGPYPLGPIDLDEGTGNAPPAHDGMVCARERTNCGRNYEGLCLANHPAAGQCIGFAMSKADGHIYCLVDQAGKLAVDRTRKIQIIGKGGALADCAFSDDDTLLVGSNLFDLAHVYRIDGWRDPATAKVITVGMLGVGFPETIAARGDIIYRMSDTGGAPSLMAKYRCPR